MSGAKGRSGGARSGAGRPLGSKNPRTIAANEAARALPYASDPMRWLVTLMSDPRQDLKLRLEAARAVLPYLHPRPG